LSDLGGNKNVVSERGEQMQKVGIIGCGGIAQVHGWVLQSMENVVLTAVCDVEKDRAVALSGRYAAGNATVYTDWHKLCDSDVDVVHICTPHFLHAPMATELLKHGKAVFMEKPCAISREQFKALKKEDSLHPGKLGFCFQNRYNETTQAVDRMIGDGKIGAVTGGRAFVTWRRDEDYYGGSPWKGALATEGGGVLMNQSIHTLDLLLRYLGMPEQVEATYANHHLKGIIEVEDTVEAWMAFEGGKRACFYASNGYVTDAPVLLELQGEKGRITVNGSEVTLCTAGGGTSHSTYEIENGIGKGYWGCGHQACIRDFYRCLEQGSAFQGDIKGVENTFETMMRIYEAGRYGL